MGDRVDAGILYGPRGMLVLDFPPCRGVRCVAPADGMPRRGLTSKTACPRGRKISRGEGPGSRRRGLPSVVEGIQRPGAEPTDRPRLCPEPDPAQCRHPRDRGARRPRRRNRRILSAVAAGRWSAYPDRAGHYDPSSLPLGPRYFGATPGARAAWELDFWGKFRRGVESDAAAYLASVATYDDVLANPARRCGDNLYRHPHDPAADRDRPRQRRQAA